MDNSTYPDNTFFASEKFEITVHNVNYERLFLTYELILKVLEIFYMFCIKFSQNGMLCKALFLTLSSGLLSKFNFFLLFYQLNIIKS